MKIIVEHEDGKVETFQNVTDAYIAVRQPRPARGRKGITAYFLETKSYSWGDVRELVKEIEQSAVELQNHLAEEVRKAQAAKLAK